MSANSLKNSVRNYLASHHMFVDDEWLTGCVEYLTEDSSNNYSERDIQNLAKEQWLLNDLKDICPGSLPPNLKNLQKTVLNGRFVLQINAALDIGTPAYQQYLKLQKVNMENIEATTHFDDKVPSHRMVKLCLTDGVQAVSAIEYKPMRNLSCDITPGCKVLIKGPIECRRGVLLLTESAIELLGGEVQEIAVTNSLAGLISSKLGVPMTQEPHPPNTFNTIPPPPTQMPPPPTQMPPPPPQMPPPPTQMPPPPTQMPPPPPQMPPRPDHEDTRPVARVTSLQVSAFNDDDIDIDQIAAIEEQFDNSSKEYNRESQVDNPSKRAFEGNNTKPEKKFKTDYVNQDTSLKLNTSNDYPDENDLFFEDDEYLKEMEAKFDENDFEAKKPVVVPSEPFVYIKQINELSEGEKSGRIFRVKGQIMKLLSKLSVGKDGWSLRCTIIDGTGTIDVDFTSDVLSKLVGYTPQEMNQLKKEMIKRPELKQQAVSALQKAKDSLQMLYCIIELTILEVPKITCLIPFEESHVDLLKTRLEGSVL